MPANASDSDSLLGEMTGVRNPEALAKFRQIPRKRLAATARRYVAHLFGVTRDNPPMIPETGLWLSVLQSAITDIGTECEDTFFYSEHFERVVGVISQDPMLNAVDPALIRFRLQVIGLLPSLATQRMRCRRDSSHSPSDLPLSAALPHSGLFRERDSNSEGVSLPSGANHSMASH